METPDDIKRLVDQFERNREVYTDPSYNETQTRHEFIDPFFAALGWDIDNTRGYAEPYKDVVHEDAIKIGSATKAPDYAFRIGGARKFFVEAKKPAVNIKEDMPSAFQLRRYAWSAKLPLSILTDFEELAIYDCRLRPTQHDKPAIGRIMYLSFSDYIPRWEEISSIFSREAVLKGSFDKYAEGVRGKKGTSEVDDEFLKEIEEWREKLAKTIALRNGRLSQRELNYAVQKTIDRIIFLRICEDRGIETYGTLQSLVNGERIYKRMIEVFQRADAKYNSGLFHFELEKERGEAPDELSLKLSIDDKPLREIIGGLYYPESSYEFSVLPSDILGQVYEQFLGKVIRLTKGHQAKVEEKPEVKKAGGVYYTPTYIVDYIVKNTVGKLLEGKTPKQATALRILDPACGSGSFLLGAYEYLLAWHRDWYMNDGTEKWCTAKNATLFQAQGGDWRLTTAERKRILLNNIYGVDIDSQAVEVTKLSLLLKVLEGENEESINQQLKIFHERALPDLGNNIKCGNSLVGTDYYDGKLIIDQEERNRINPFDWQSGFKPIMDEGGFDVVIGNPPYVRQEILGSDFKEYAEHRYSVYHGIADLYAYFIEKGVSLLRKNGIFGYIVANKWLRANYGEPLRGWLKGEGILEIIDFGDLPVFKNATTYPCILRVRKGEKSKEFSVTDIHSLEGLVLDEYVRHHHHKSDRSSLRNEGWSLTDQATEGLFEKLRRVGVPLGEYVHGKIYYGIKTGLNEAFVIDEETKRRLIKVDRKSAELIKPFLAGREVKRYQTPIASHYVIFARRGIDIKKYPAVEKHLSRFREQLEPKPNGYRGQNWKGRKPGAYRWFEIQDTIDYYEEFERPKILWPEIAGSARFTMDRKSLFANNKVYIIPHDSLYLLALLNSTLLRAFIESMCTDLQGDSFNFSAVFVDKTPIYPADQLKRDSEERYQRLVNMADRMLRFHRDLSLTKTAQDKTSLQRQIEATDKLIDQEVYELYGLTDGEISIVEQAVGSTKTIRAVS